ncbi:MAG TPA: adenylate/guanylate cyclase domain-containing protein [Egibacteraceae bacterium]|nr:adenylate/guanylate cyclase domain-containing protein [Egibacteraceae bacterium]
MEGHDVPRGLAPLKAALTTATWSALLLDEQWRICWVSDELRQFVSDDPSDDLGVGRHIAGAFLRSPWIDTVHPDSVQDFLETFAPYARWAFEHSRLDPADEIPEPFLPLLHQVEAQEPPLSWCFAFKYLPPGGTEDDIYVVDVVWLRLFDDTGELGCVGLFDIGVPPHLVALLARGDVGMYNRMAGLIEPGHREAAILFCDLHGSGMLSRRLPTSEYFDLVRRLWRGVDAAVVANGGIVGKHAGDGATAFFLADDVGGRSDAARAALLTARAIHDIGSEVFADITDDGCLMKVGLHWGPNLFMGQLLPGGRLDVTALGDEVNEASRIEQAAQAHQTLASKQLIEGLSPAHAAELGISTRTLTYRLLSDIAPHQDKIVRDAGSLAVAAV